MTKRNKRSIEREINNILYKNLTREGISMDHLDPSRMKNWPLHNYSESETDYVNLLPPSYRDPFPSAQHSSPQKPRRRNASLNLRKSLHTEWSDSIKSSSAYARKRAKKSFAYFAMISVAGVLLTYTLLLMFKMLPLVMPS